MDERGGGGGGGEGGGGGVVDSVGGGGGCLAELQTSWLQLAISVGYGLLCLSRETGVNLPLRSLLCTLCDTHLKVNKCFMGQVNEPPSPGLMGACARRETAPGVSRRCHAPEKTHSQVRTICDVHSVGKNKIRSSLFLCESEIKNINCV